MLALWISRPARRAQVRRGFRAEAQCLPRSYAGGLLGIVGESYRQDELRALSRRTTDASRFRADLVAYAADVADEEPDRRWFLAVLVREPDNPKDPEAVAVHAESGGKLGYLKREDARRYAQVFRSLEKRGYDAAACPALLNGGGDKSFGRPRDLRAWARPERSHELRPLVASTSGAAKSGNEEACRSGLLRHGHSALGGQFWASCPASPPPRLEGKTRKTA